MAQDLKNRTVVVTGGTGALGRAVVARLVRDGARPVVTWRNEKELRESPFAAGVRTFFGEERPKLVIGYLPVT